MLKWLRARQARRREIERHAALWELMEAGKVVYFAGDQVAVHGKLGHVPLRGYTAVLWRDKLRREGALG